MYQYVWDAETGGLLLTTDRTSFSREPRPVYYQELDILGFDKYWHYTKDDSAPYMWAEANNYIYRGRLVAKTKGGSLYVKPELILLEDPEPNGAPLKPVDVSLMVEKNNSMLNVIADEAVRKIYNTYVEHQKKVSVFYVAFSGGKDSVVVLDLAQRALPHNNFFVMFGDTDMEFPTTYELVGKIERTCTDLGIPFYTARSELSSESTWERFGPPARKNRWCCTVHKSAPVINTLCKLLNKQNIRVMMITGVRGEESSSRSAYDQLSLGKKIVGQYSFHPILEWTSYEVWLYIYSMGLPINYAYKLGFNRVGCIMCPNSSEKHEFMKKAAFPKLVDEYCDRIVSTSSKDLSGDNKKSFLDTGGWKTRFSGRELKISEQERVVVETTDRYHLFYLAQEKDNWIEWYKTMGSLVVEDDSIILEFEGKYRKCRIVSDETGCRMYVDNIGKSKNTIDFLYLFKCVLIKTQYCIECGTCEAECPHRNIRMSNGTLSISDNCVKCHGCLKILSGCLYYNSIRGSNDVKSLKGINRYLTVGVDKRWIIEYEKSGEEPGNRKTDTMYGFLSDADIVVKRKRTDFGEKFFEMDLAETTPWALALSNLVYTPAFNWYVKNIPFYVTYTRDMLDVDMGSQVTDKAKGEFWNGFKVILDTNGELRLIGLGELDVTRKTTRSGEEKKTLNSIERLPWSTPDPKVILYSLYKFAEACDGYYQFTLSRLLDHEVESDGVSPTQIFGLDRDVMEPLLNGLSIQYPEFINVSFTLGLETINLTEAKTSKDVLELF